MLLRLALLFVLMATAAASPGLSDFDLRVVRFQRHWDRFIRAYWGCKATDTERAMCNSSMSSLNLKEFEAARREATGLF